MSRCRGYTLVELMVVIVIFGFLMTMVAPSLSTWQTKHRAEAEIEKLHSDLQYARMKAYTEKTVHGVWLGGGYPFKRHALMRDANGDGSLVEGEDTLISDNDTFKYPLTSKGTVLSRITFDSRGFCNNVTTLYVDKSGGASVDCLKTSFTRIKIGKWDGSSCNPK